MHYLLFIIYLSLCSFLMLKIPFFCNSGLSRIELLILFLIKIFAGVLLGLVCTRYYPVNDYFFLNDEGIKENSLLLKEPVLFFKSIMYSPYENKYGGFFNSVGSYWNDLRNNIIIKILAVLNLLTKGNYYFNSIFFNLFGFFGHVALFRVFIKLYPDKKWFIMIGCFLLPSTLYFSSGIHKDLIVFTALGLYCYALYQLATESFSFGRMIVLFFSFLTILLMRNYLAMILIPCSLGFLWSEKLKRKPLYIFGGIFSLGLLLLFMVEIFFPAFQPLKIITQKQQDFLQLHQAASQIELSNLKPEMKSLLSNLPEAFNHGFLRPYLCEGGGQFTHFLATELLIMNLLILLAFVRIKGQVGKIRPFILFALSICIIMFLFTGYIVPNTSSIIRYKSLYLPLIITPVLCLLPKKLNSI